MEDLRLPVIRETRHEVRYLPMDDYLKFVLTNLRYTVNISAARKMKRKLSVSVGFILK